MPDITDERLALIEYDESEASYDDIAAIIARLRKAEAAAEHARRLHVYDEDGKVLTQAAVNRLLCEREELTLARRRARDAEKIANIAMSEGLWARIEYADLRSPRERDEWHEDDGAVLWWNLPVAEPPYAGTPLDDDFPDYVAHWTPIVVPVEGGSEGEAQSEEVVSAAPVLHRDCYLCGGHLEIDRDSHVSRADCIRTLKRRALVLLSNRDKAVDERNDALRRMEDAEAREKRLQTALSTLLTADDAAVRAATRKALPDATSAPRSPTEVITDEELFAIEAVAAIATEPVALMPEQAIHLLARLRRAEAKAVIAAIKDEDPVVWSLRLAYQAKLDGMLVAAEYCKEWGYRHADEHGPIRAAYKLAKDLRVLVKMWGGDDA